MRIYSIISAGLFVLLSAISVAAQPSVTSLQSFLTHATSCPTGVTNARINQHCIDLDDYAEWLCILPTGGASDTLCDEADDWAQLGTMINYTGVPGGTNPNSQSTVIWTIKSASVASNPNFSNEAGFELLFTGLAGQNDRDTAAKKTFLPFHINAQYNAAGQRFSYSSELFCYGMGDCFESSNHVTAAAGVSAGGDEGTSFRTMQLTQQPNLTKTTISSVTAPTTCNTTITQDITRNLAVQAVTVASTTGCVVGDWLTVDRGSIYVTDGKIEAVKLTAVGAGTVTAQFRHSHTSGAPLTPATVLQLGSTSQLGEQRYLVNLTSTPVTAGTISATSGTGLTGSGTSWSSSMVGGDATIPGCIALTSDDYTVSPFAGASTLKSWYGIASVISATALNISHRDAVGIASYHGNGAPSNYTVRPCARILRLITNSTNTAITGQVVLETNTFTWTAADSVELPLSVDGDVTGEFMRVAWYTPGAALRGIYTAWNNGAQQFDSAYRATGGTANLGKAFRVGLSIEPKTNVGIEIMQTTDVGAMDLTPRAAVDDKRIKWGGRYIGPPVTDNNGLVIEGTNSSAGGTLSFLPESGGDLMAIMEFKGHLDLVNYGGGQNPRLRLMENPSTYLTIQSANSTSGLFGGRALSLTGTDVSPAGRIVQEFLSSGTSGVTAMTTNSTNTAVSGTNYGSFWTAQLASVWDGAAASKTYFTHRLLTAAGTNALTTWEMRAGTNASFASNPVRFSIRQDGQLTLASTLIVPVDGGLQHLTGTRPTCDAAHRGTVFYVAGGVGVADTHELCRKDAANAYAWVTLF